MNLSNFRALPRLLLGLTLGLAAALLGACSKGDAPPTPAPNAAASTKPAMPSNSVYDQVTSKAKGFTVGQMMSVQTVYVLFDPQCPHCGHLWQSSQPLLTKVKFVWVPIAFNQGKSLTQATVLLSASDPATTMSEHEKLLLAGQGGIAAPTTPDPQRVKEVQSNTELLNLLGADAVPYILAKNRKTGALIAQSGAMGTPELAALLGID